MTINALTILPFGKHAGELAGDVCDEDPTYIVWLDENTDHDVDDWLVGVAMKLASEERAERGWE